MRHLASLAICALFATNVMSSTFGMQWIDDESENDEPPLVYNTILMDALIAMLESDHSVVVMQALQVLEEMSSCFVCTHSLCARGAPASLMPLLHPAAEEKAQLAALRVFRNFTSGMLVDDVVRTSINEVAEEARVLVYKIRDAALLEANSEAAHAADGTEAAAVDPGADMEPCSSCDYSGWLSFGLGCSDTALQVRALTIIRWPSSVDHHPLTSLRAAAVFVY
jgi:hypothetical protein